MDFSVLVKALEEFGANIEVNSETVANSLARIWKYMVI